MQLHVSYKCELLFTKLQAITEKIREMEKAHQIYEGPVKRV